MVIINNDDYSLTNGLSDVGLGIRFFGYVRFGCSAVKKLRCTRNGNRSVLYKIKNRRVLSSVFRFGVRFLPKFTELSATSADLLS